MTEPAQPARIDVHHHVLPAFYREALERIGQADSGGAQLPKWDETGALALLDATQIRTAVVSVSSPGVYFGDVAFARDLARRCNTFMAELVQRHPQRYRALAILPLPDVGAALEELNHALDTLGLNGVILQASYGPQYLGDPAFEPLMTELNRRGTVAFLHPTTPPGSDVPQLAVPGFMVEFVFDTTRALANLIVSGTFERHPAIRWIVAHAGGAAPYLTGRFERGGELMPKLREQAPQGARAYLSRLHYDTAISTGPEPLGVLSGLVGPGQILYGSDYPYLPPELIQAGQRELAASPLLDAAAQAELTGGAAHRLFPDLP